MRHKKVLVPQARIWAEKLSHVYADWHNVGMREALGPRVVRARYRMLELAGLPMRGRYMRYRIGDVPYSFHGRYGTTDPWAFHQVFIDREFRPLDCVKDVRLVVDCGANVGYASLWFLNHFPLAHVLAVEPDPTNFALCARNLQPYEDRVSLFNAAVWSHSTGLRIHRHGNPEFDYWTLQVRETVTDEQPDVTSLSIGQLLNDSGFERIDILKMDIEGAEATVFASEPHVWLRYVRNLVIELHEDPCTDIFFAALSQYEYELLHVRELVFCLNLRPRVDASLC
jgi:FkbM family methyltransferase